MAATHDTPSIASNTLTNQQKFLVSALYDLRSPTSTRLHNHVLVLLEHNVLVVVKVQHGDTRQFRRRAAHFWNGAVVDGVDESLDDRVVSAVESLAERERALAVAVVRLVTHWGDDPVLPPDVPEAHIQTMSLAQVRRCRARQQVRGVLRLSPIPLSTTALSIRGWNHN